MRRGWLIAAGTQSRCVQERDRIRIERAARGVYVITVDGAISLANSRWAVSDGYRYPSMNQACGCSLISPSIFSASRFAAGNRFPQPAKSRASVSIENMTVAMRRSEPFARLAQRDFDALLKIFVNSRLHSMMSRASECQIRSGRLP